jgi:hypothetical protein
MTHPPNDPHITYYTHASHTNTTLDTTYIFHRHATEHAQSHTYPSYPILSLVFIFNVYLSPIPTYKKYLNLNLNQNFPYSHLLLGTLSFNLEQSRCSPTPSLTTLKSVTFNIYRVGQINIPSQIKEYNSSDGGSFYLLLDMYLV